MIFYNYPQSLIGSFSLQGFSIIRTSIPKYLIWVYWGFNPLPYGIRALAINEMTTPAWGAAGPAVLESYGIYSGTEWIWIGVGYLWGFLLFLTAAGVAALLWTNPPQSTPIGKRAAA